MQGQDHVADTEGRGNGFGKGVKVKDVFGLIFALLLPCGVILINVFLSQYGASL